VADGEVFVGTSNALVVYGPPVVPTSGPVAPSNLTAASPNYQLVNLSWQDNSNNEDYFSIRRSTDNVTFTEVGRASANAQSYADTTGLLAQTLYYYKVIAHNSFAGGTDSAPSNTAQVTTPIPPPVGTGDGAAATYFNDVNGVHLVNPPALTRVDPQINNVWGTGGPGAPIGVNGFSARWTGRIQAQYSESYTFYTESDDGVRLFLKPIASGTYTTLVDHFNDHGLAEDSFTITLSAGQFYDFRMEYYENGGDATAQLLWSSTSTPKAAIPRTQLYSGTAPNAPTNLTVAPASGTQLNLSWNDNALNETGYTLERVNPDQSVTDIVLPANTFSYMDTGLTPDTKYTYRVRANNFAANSAYTPDLTITTNIAPPTPSGSHLTSVTTSSVSFAWQLNSTKPSNTESGVTISRKTGANGFFQVIADLPPGSTSFTDNGPGVNGLTPGTFYDYHIQAHNIAGYSDFAGVSTTTRTVAPTGVLAVGGGDKVSLSWTAPFGADTFNVYRSTTPGGEGTTPLAVEIDGTSFVDTTAVGGNTYYYTVTATTDGGESAASAEQSTYAHMPGDANDNRTVDFNDLVLMAQNYNGSAGKVWGDGDFNGDGLVDFNDLVILAQNYNTSRSAGPVGSQPIAGAAPMPSLASVIANSNPTTTPPPSAKPPKPPVKPVPPRPIVKPVVTAAPVRNNPTVIAVPAPRPPVATFGSTRISTARKLSDLLG
jgi:fibronectin type 3 domain-containing protein